MSRPDPDLVEVVYTQAILEGYSPRMCPSYKDDARYLLNLAQGDLHLAKAVLAKAGFDPGGQSAVEGYMRVITECRFPRAPEAL